MANQARINLDKQFEATSSRSLSPSTLSMCNNRSSAIQQKKLVNAIASSPRQTTQLKRGQVAQRVSHLPSAVQGHIASFLDGRDQANLRATSHALHQNLNQLETTDKVIWLLRNGRTITQINGMNFNLARLMVAYQAAQNLGIRFNY